MIIRGLAMAGIVKGLVSHFEIGSDPVRVPVMVLMKSGHWDDSLHRRCPNIPHSKLN